MVSITLNLRNPNLRSAHLNLRGNAHEDKFKQCSISYQFTVVCFKHEHELVMAESPAGFYFSLDPVHLSQGLIAGMETSARLTRRQLMLIAERRFSGVSPLRPNIGPEYALAIIWAEAALAVGPDGVGGEEREQIERFLNTARLEHNNNWISPSGSDLIKINLRLM